VQILKLLSGGLTNKEIGIHTNLVEGTIKVFMSHIFRKLGVSSRLEAALYVLSNPDLFN